MTVHIHHGDECQAGCTTTITYTLVRVSARPSQLPIIISWTVMIAGALLIVASLMAVTL